MYITVETKDGKRELLKMPNHNRTSLMQLLKEHGYPIPGICGGMGICASCHIRVIGGLEKIPEAGDTELAMLESLPDWHVDSRLACQIFPDLDMNGIIIKLIRK